MGQYLTTDHGILHWVDYGGAGEPLVLVHGLGGSTVNWDAIAPALTTLGRVVAPDLPGFGLSPPARDWDLTTHATALEAFLKSLDAPVTLVGNSMGGLLSEMVASNSPHLVSSLVLISPATPPRLPDPRIHWPTARRLALQATPGIGTGVSRWIMSRYSPDQVVRMSLAAITHDPARVPITMIDDFNRLARIRWALPWAPAAVPSTATSIARLWATPRRFVQVIRAIKAPTLVVHGVSDPIVSPTSVEWMCGLRPDWELVQMEGTGHTPQLDAPVRLLGVIVPWLERHLDRETTEQAAK